MRRFKRPAQQNRAGNLVLLAVSSLLAFLLCEFAIRRLPASDMMGWTMVPPVAERVAAAGEPRPGRPRLLVLGDSFTEWRDGSDESFPRIAARILGRSGQETEVVNLAQAGTGLSEYMGNLLRHGPGLRPDLVVIGLYLGNDMVGASTALDTPEGEAAVLAQPAEATPNAGRPLWWRLAKKSVALNYLYRLGKQHIPALRSGFFEQTLAYTTRQAGLDERVVAERLAAVDPGLLAAARADRINGWDLASAVADPDYYDELARIEPGSTETAKVEAALRDLRAIVARARALGAEVAVVLLPPPVWVAERYGEYFRHLGYGRLGPVTGPLPLAERIKADLAAQGVTAIDPLPALRASTAEAYLPRDVHPNRLGQRLIGEAVAAALPDLLRLRAAPTAAGH